MKREAYFSHITGHPIYTNRAILLRSPGHPSAFFLPCYLGWVAGKAELTKEKSLRLGTKARVEVEDSLEIKYDRCALFYI